jgi:hypothetical protein
MYPTIRQMSDMPREAIQSMNHRYGENLPALRASRIRSKLIRQAIDQIEHCCTECDELDRRYEE